MKKICYENQNIRLQGEPFEGSVHFAAEGTADGGSLGSVILEKHTATDGRACGILNFQLLPHCCTQRCFENVLEIAEKYFFKDFDLTLLLCEVDPETDQEKIAALVSYGYDPDREQLTDKTDMFVLERS